MSKGFFWLDIAKPPPELFLIAGITQKRSELAHDHQSRTSLLRAAPNTSLQAAKPEPPVSSQQTHAPCVTVQVFSDDDEDASLLIPLAFAAKPKATPARRDDADLALSNGTYDAAFGSNADTLTLPTQRAACLSSLALELGQNDQTNATADLGSQPRSAPK